MVQRHKSIRVPLIGAILLGLLAGVLLFAAARKRLAKPDAASGVEKHSVDTPSGDVLKYWTEDKMRSAKPAKMPKVKSLKPAKKRPKRPPV
jgi:hypothetical protein